MILRNRFCLKVLELFGVARRAVRVMLEEKKASGNSGRAPRFEDCFLKARFSRGGLKSPNLYRETLEFRAVSAVCAVTRLVASGFLGLRRLEEKLADGESGRKGLQSILVLAKRVFGNRFVFWAAEASFEIWVCATLNSIEDSPQSGQAAGPGPASRRLGNCRLCSDFYSEVLEILTDSRPEAASESETPRVLRCILEQAVTSEPHEARDDSICSVVESFDVRDIRSVGEL